MVLHISCHPLSVILVSTHVLSLKAYILTLHAPIPMSPHPHTIILFLESPCLFMPM